MGGDLLIVAFLAFVISTFFCSPGSRVANVPSDDVEAAQGSVAAGNGWPAWANEEGGGGEGEEADGKKPTVLEESPDSYPEVAVAQDDMLESTMAGGAGWVEMGEELLEGEGAAEEAEEEAGGKKKDKKRSKSRKGATDAEDESSDRKKRDKRAKDGGDSSLQKSKSHKKDKHGEEEGEGERKKGKEKDKKKEKASKEKSDEGSSRDGDGGDSKKKKREKEKELEKKKSRNK